MIRAFLSYSSKDVSAFPDLPSLIKSELERLSSGACEVVVDTEDRQLPGTSLREFEQQVVGSDFVLILWGNHYAESIGTTGHSAREFELALKAHEAGIKVYPIQLSKSSRKAMPDAIKDIAAFDLSFLNDVNAKSDPIREAKIASELDRVWGKLSSNRPRRDSADWRSEEQAVNFLFEQSRAEFNERIYSPFIDRLIVKTHFTKDLTGTTGFLVGRKGVGKSATTQAMPIMANPPVRETIPFNFDRLEWAPLIRLVGESRGDDYIFGETKRLRKAWESLFLFMIAFHHKKQIQPDFLDDSLLFKATLNLKPHEAFGVAFTRILEKAGELSSDAKRAGHLHPLAGSVLAESVLGRRISAWLEKYLESASGCEICIVGDNFDLRTNLPEDPAEANHFLKCEKNILTALAEYIVSEFPAGQCLIPKNACRFLIAIPNDRMLIISRELRDAIKTNVRSLYWTGIELSALLRKRIAALSLIRDVDFRDPAITSPLLKQPSWRKADPKPDGQRHGGHLLMKRFSERLKAILPELPESIDFQFNDQKISMPLFSYVLRHTLWRPRDVLYFFASLILAALAARRRGENVGSEQVRSSIALRTKKLCKEEVIAEYRDFHPRIEEALNQFKGAPQVMKGADFKARLVKVYSMSMRRDKERDPARNESDVDLEGSRRGRVLFRELFELGLVGFLPNDQAGRKDAGHHFVFSFHLRPAHFPTVDEFDRTEMCFHPILKEHLALDTSSNLFVLNYDESWLIDQDRWVENNSSLAHQLAWIFEEQAV